MKAERVLCLLLALLALASFAVGRYPVQPGAVIGILTGVGGPYEDNMVRAVRSIRLPRVLLACLVGASLAAAGAAFQTVFQNPMAAPDVLGASSGAGFGASLAILLGLSRRPVALCAFGVSLLSVAAVRLLGKRIKGSPTVSLLLAGMMVSALFSAGTSYVKLAADPSNQLPAITYWLMGSLSGTRMSDLWFCLPWMVLGFAPLLLLRWRLNLLAMPADDARAMGVNVPRLRNAALVCATLLTAVSVAMSGTIGWVGLVSPHMARRLVGSDGRRLIPASMLIGALFLLAMDDLARCLTATEIPIGILTALLGAPIFFLFLTWRGGASDA